MTRLLAPFLLFAVSACPTFTITIAEDEVPSRDARELQVISNYVGTQDVMTFEVSDKSTRRRTAKESLEETTSCDFTNTPLKDIIEFLSRVHKTPITFSPETKKESTRRETVTRKDIKLKELLKVLLDPNLTYKVERTKITVIRKSQ